MAFAYKTMGTGDKRRRQTARRYIDEGYLTEDLHWVNQSTGDITPYRASWLEPTTTVTDDEEFGTSGSHPAPATPHKAATG